MKEKIRKQIDNVYMMLLILILIASSILIRKSQYNNIIQILILVLSMTYIIIRNIEKEPIKIINNKLDIMVLILVITAFIPLIFGTYVSLSSTMIVGINYISLYSVYILIKEICSRNNKRIEYINIVIIIQAIIFVIIGIENLTSNKILPLLGIENIINGESRLVSIFGNPNVLASYLLFTFFIVLHKVINEKDMKKKIMLSIFNTIYFIGIILTYSKAIYLIMPIIIILYMICNKNKETNIEIIQDVITYAIVAGIYILIFNKLIAIENYLFIWIFLLVIIVLEVLINMLNIKTKFIVDKIKKKYIIVIIFIITIFCVTYTIIELKNIIPYNVFSNNNTSSYEAKKINHIEGNKQYKIIFNLEAEAYSEDKVEIEDMYQINIIERDARNIEIKNTEIEFGNYKGTKELEIFTHEKTREFKIEFKAKYQYIIRNLIIKELTINDEIIPLRYKHLPIKLIDKVKDINIKYKTAQERIQFIKNAIKLSKENLLTGIGGECWQYKYGEVQEYDYTSSDIHSYPIQILLEFGIIGFITLLGIYFYIVLIKNNNKYLGMKFALIVIMIHSAIDSEMKILYMQILVFTYFAIFSSLKIEYKTERKIINICNNVIYTIITSITIYLLVNPSIYIFKEKISEYENKKVGLTINSSEYLECNKKIEEIYEKIIKYEKNEEISHYTEYLKAYINSGQIEKIEEYYYKIKQYENKWKQKSAKIIEKNNSIVTIIKELEKQNNLQLYEWIIKFAEICQNENDETEKDLEKALNNKYQTKEESREYVMLETNNKYIKSIYEKYILGIQVINDSEKDITKELLNGEIKIENKNILLYHTHGTEAYYSSSQYEEIDYRKTLNEEYNILSVGDTLKKALEEKGYKVIHLRDYNDLEGVKGAYDNSEIKVKRQLENEKIDIIFDIHRDANLEINKQDDTITIDGQEVAKIRFVIASGHENWKENLKWAVAIQKEADELYPGLFEPMLIYDNNYNQNISKYATLIEVGDDSNTIEEANRSMQYFANVLNKIL